MVAACDPELAAAPREARKIGSIGIHVSRGVSTHGLAINVNNDLQPFEWIVPCGIEAARMTSLARRARRRAGLRRLRHRRRVGVRVGARADGRAGRSHGDPPVRGLGARLHPGGLLAAELGRRARRRRSTRRRSGASSPRPRAGRGRPGSAARAGGRRGARGRCPGGVPSLKWLERTSVVWMKARLTIVWSIRIDSSVVYHQIPSRTNSSSSSASSTSLRGRKPASLISRWSSSASPSITARWQASSSAATSRSIDLNRPKSRKAIRPSASRSMLPGCGSPENRR